MSDWLQFEADAAGIDTLLIASLRNVTTAPAAINVSAGFGGAGGGRVSPALRNVADHPLPIMDVGEGVGGSTLDAGGAKGEGGEGPRHNVMKDEEGTMAHEEGERERWEGGVICRSLCGEEFRGRSSSLFPHSKWGWGEDGGGSECGGGGDSPLCRRDESNLPSANDDGPRRHVSFQV